jgi:ABC-type sugar transport system ATPase subunit
MAQVILSGLSKRFGKVVAVDKVGLTIADGEFVSFLGPSGCGKTTTLNMIAGLETPSEGRITIGDLDVTHVPAMRRDIAMVFQSYALYPHHMTVAGNLGFALRVRGFDAETRQKRISSAAAALGLGGLLDRYPRQLSGGQRQRVALGRALVREPKVFLLDEPLSNLDAVLRIETRAEMKRLFAAIETTAIYVTHDQAEAMTMSDRIAVFRDGRMQQVGTPLEIYRSPANRFVASFVGSPPMVLIEGRVRNGCAEVAGVALPLENGAAKHEGAAITVGFRPEDVLVGTGKSQATIELVEHLGSSVLAHLRLNGHRLVAQAAGDARLKPGGQVPVQLSAQTMYCFDAETELAIQTPGENRTKAEKATIV